MTEKIFLLNGFNRAWIPPVDDGDTCINYTETVDKNVPIEQSNHTLEVSIVTLIFLALFAFIWLKFERKYYKNKRY